MTARLWSFFLTSLKLAQPRPAPHCLAAEPAPALWLERDVDASVARHPAGRHRAS